MRFMLDANIVSALIRNPFSPAAERVRAERDKICISVIVAAELKYGCARKASRELSHRVETFLSTVSIVPFEAPAIGHYGRIRAELEAAGRTIGPIDFFIAAHALALGMTVVTANVDEFQRVPGLAVENWLA